MNNPADVPLLTPQPGIGGVIKQSPEDFVVEELPAYQPSGSGDHLFLWVQKRDTTSSKLLQELANHFGVNRRDIGQAGIKDRRAVTRQFVSIPARGIDLSTAVGPIGDDIEVLDATLHTNKLKTGHLRGNRFVIILRELSMPGAQAEAHARDALDEIARRGLLNAFGPQRFGRDGSTMRDGFALLSGNPGRRTRQDRRYKRLAASAAQSAVFNEVLRLRIERGVLQTALLGDRLNRVGVRGQLKIAEDTLAEGQAGLDEGSLVVTGPMWGPKMFETDLDAAELERDALERVGATVEMFRNARLTPGTRRDALIRFLDEPVCSAVDDGLRLAFSLPSGAYATLVLRELTKLDFSAWEAP